MSVVFFSQKLGETVYVYYVGSDMTCSGEVYRLTFNY